MFTGKKFIYLLVIVLIGYTLLFSFGGLDFLKVDVLENVSEDKIAEPQVEVIGSEDEKLGIDEQVERVIKVEEVVKAEDEKKEEPKTGEGIKAEIEKKEEVKAVEVVKAEEGAKIESQKLGTNENVEEVIKVEEVVKTEEGVKAEIEPDINQSVAEAAIDKFKPGNSIVEYGNTPYQIKYDDVPGNETIVDILNSNYLLKDKKEVEKVKDSIFSVKLNDEDAKEDKNLKKFKIVGVEKRSFDRSVDVVTLSFSTKPNASKLAISNFVLQDQNYNDVTPKALIVKNKDLILAFDDKRDLDFSMLKFRNIESANNKILKGGILPILQNTEKLDYDELISNLYGSYLATITDDRVNIDKNISFGAMNDVRSSSTISVSFKNQAEVSNSCNILVYGTDLTNVKQKSDVFHLKNYTLLTKKNSVTVMDQTLFNAFYEHMNRDEKIIGYLQLGDLDIVRGFPTLYINLKKPKDVNVDDLYKGKLLLDLICL